MSFFLSQTVRSDFIRFFEDKGHRFVPSSPVVPQDDPTLLFTNAGMNQFKPIFLGNENPDYRRAVNSQKCIRVSGKHNDLEEVGHDTYHHTFFEMLGNWSFGDYYKPEAIRWAWELLTKNWGLPKDRLYATVYNQDDESASLWRDVTDIDSTHILRFGEKDNFWEMGDTGPCGPCSEIHIDLTTDGRGLKLVNAGSPDVIELWNLVFIQYNRNTDSTLSVLPSKHVDTGAGFERLTRVLQRKSSNYDIDLFQNIIRSIESRTKLSYADSSQKPAFRVIADHLRMLTFSITDGAIPGNDGRGYVLRRILRRAAMYGRKLAMHEPFLCDLVSSVVTAMGDAFPEIKSRQGFVEKVIRGEEEHFNATLDRGLEVFEEIAGSLDAKGRQAIPGADAFRLYDTFGFPLDLTRVMATEKGLSVDEDGFNQVMMVHRQKSRDEGKKKFIATSVEWKDLTATRRSEFLGYDSMEATGRLCRYSQDSNQLRLVFDKTPFYPEAGGQIGDKGAIVLADRTLEIWDTQRIGDDIVHFADSNQEFLAGPTNDALLKVDEAHRLDIMRHHTATHLLHAALRLVLGPHVHQAGSVVSSDKLRFDFAHFEKVSDAQILDIERMVNDRIRANIPLQHHRNLPISEARALGALSFFGDKYGDFVNVVQFGDFSMEFCGGTHVQRTGVIGYFRIISESAISSGVRRIEAVTGTAAEQLLSRERGVSQELTELLNIKSDELVTRIRALIEENRRLALDKAHLELRFGLKAIDELLSKATNHGALRVITAQIELPETVDIKEVGDYLRTKLGSGIGVLAVVRKEEATLLCVVTDDLTKERKWHAGNLVKELAKMAGGSGGGRPNMAAAGIKDISYLNQIFRHVHDVIGK